MTNMFVCKVTLLTHVRIPIYTSINKIMVNCCFIITIFDLKTYVHNTFINYIPQE